MKRVLELVIATLVLIVTVTTLESSVPRPTRVAAPGDGEAYGVPWFTLRLPDLPTFPGAPARLQTVRAIYFTSWSAGVASRMAQATALIKSSELNAVIIDLKDTSGKVAFPTSSPLIKRIGSEQNRIGDFPQLVARFHQEGVYVIGRIAVFQDQHLVSVRSDLAVKDTAGHVWRDHKGLGWVDPAAREVWEYVAEVAREAAKAGVDELNFDYIRFPSDGALSVIRYPVFDERVESKRQVIRRFFAFLAEALTPLGKVRSVDLFGLTTVRHDDLGIGQVFEDALLYFDFVCPMVYPSHYAVGFLQYRNPAAYPYEVIRYSLASALDRQMRFAQSVAPITRESLAGDSSESFSTPIKLARLRPWLQAFDLGAPYPPAMIRKEIQAVYDVGLNYGWYLWSPSNVYEPGSFEPRQNPARLRNATPRE